MSKSETFSSGYSVPEWILQLEELARNLEAEAVGMEAAANDPVEAARLRRERRTRLTLIQGGHDA